MRAEWLVVALLALAGPVAGQQSPGRRFELPAATSREAVARARRDATRTVARFLAAGPRVSCERALARPCVAVRVRPHAAGETPGPFGVALRAPYPQPGEAWPLSERARKVVGDDVQPVVLWESVERVAAGRDSLERWRRLAAAGTLEDCDRDDKCAQVVGGYIGAATQLLTRGRYQAASPALMAATAGDSVLARCRVQRVGATLGPPASCSELALRQAGSWLVQGAVAFSGPVPPPAVATRPGMFVPAVRLDLGRAVVATAALQEAARDALAAPPLGLEVVIRPARIVGAASGRVSRVLPRPPSYREIVQVSVFPERKDSTQIELAVEIDANVNPQNTGREEDYHLPSAAQREAYRAAVLKSLRSHLERLCPNARWRDAVTLVCGR